MKMILGILFSFFLFLSCNQGVDTSLQQATVEETFAHLLEECIQDSFDAVPGVAMSVHSPLLTQPWQGAAGFADKEGNIELKTTQPFRIASVTKTFVAAAILRLHELDSLNINDPISTYIDNSFRTILKSDGYDPQKILIKHCLNHTSGLADYISGSDEYFDRLIHTPQKHWTRKEQLEGAINWAEKIAEPGEQTTYCDTGYILLGAIIERFYQGDFAAGLRDLLKFDELGMTHTWLETLEEHPDENTQPVHRYHGKYETTDWDASIDLYGGGGLMSTTSDLAKFYAALFSNDIYDKPQTLELMLTNPAYITKGEGINLKTEEFYQYGLWTNKAFGKDIHLHTGFWGTSVLYIPAYKTSIAVNPTKGKADRLIKKVLLVLDHLNEQE